MTQHNINWKQLAAAFTSVLTLSAALPDSLGELAIIIPPKFKGWVVLAGLVATTILRTLNAVTRFPLPLVCHGRQPLRRVRQPTFWTQPHFFIPAEDALKRRMT